ncbi:LysR family transcriptional regulator [Acinetobacter sp. B5B]|uniref:LysR substrate-binding domain-containing protein n=1 Tax=Acinetobacter baretiae TaxID=2605383 RepID=UPI0018C1D21E|nr:LysR substrate-binding domain-containing protein [Acinetobacter baretiae]MBF7683137.1 LysR family transcriptional regulator [Acinetobacter baretiae]MBF7684531.1 LysR family transcriptional regulator [Acinetobacter baretiae]
MLNMLDDFYYFAMVVEHGGFSAAERATDIPKSKLSRRVYALEEHLGVRLIQRNSRQFSVTDIGQNIYRHAQAMNNAAQAAHDMVNHFSVEPRGIVRIGVPVATAQNRFAQILPAFLKQYPEVKIQMVVSNRRIDIVNENVDLALRVRAHIDDDPNLVVREIRQEVQHLFASQAYLNQYGTPKTPQSLTEHRFLSMSEDFTEQTLTLSHEHHSNVKVPLKPTIMASDLNLLKELACQNQGITLLPDTIVCDEISTQQLRYVLPEWNVPHGILHLVYPSRRGILPAVRVLIDYLVQHLK